jgi:hypothetical protein
LREEEEEEEEEEENERSCGRGRKTGNNMNHNIQRMRDIIPSRHSILPSYLHRTQKSSLKLKTKLHSSRIGLTRSNAQDTRAKRMRVTAGAFAYIWSLSGFNLPPIEIDKAVPSSSSFITPSEVMN